MSPEIQEWSHKNRSRINNFCLLTHSIRYHDINLGYQSNQPRVRRQRWRWCCWWWCSMQWRFMVASSWTSHSIVPRTWAVYGAIIGLCFAGSSLTTAIMLQIYIPGRARIPNTRRIHGGRSICWCRYMLPASSSRTGTSRVRLLIQRKLAVAYYGFILHAIVSHYMPLFFICF